MQAGRVTITGALEKTDADINDNNFNMPTIGDSIRCVGYNERRLNE